MFVERVEIQKDKVRNVILQDQLIAGTMVDRTYTTCESAGHCAVGALLFAVGKSNVELANMAQVPSAFEDTDRELLYKEFGLNTRQLDALMCANDKLVSEGSTRQQQVLDVVETLETSYFVSYDNENYEDYDDYLDDYDDEGEEGCDDPNCGCNL